MGWIVHWWGSASLYVTGEITWVMEKGLCLLGANLTDPYGKAKFRASSQTFCPWLNTFLAGVLPLADLFSAAMACFLRCLNWSTRALAAGLSEFELWSGVAAGSRPLSKRFGARPVVKFQALLWTSMARGSIMAQSC